MFQTFFEYPKPQNQILKLQVAELERTVAATRRALPDVDGIDAEVAELKVGVGGFSEVFGERTLAFFWRLNDVFQGFPRVSWLDAEVAGLKVCAGGGGYVRVLSRRAPWRV